ncbi:hypothetical protein [Ichthyenterobacterium magnum]|uniref:DUF1579 domain-containing protein n=1 Tax=Ichthyenterobacterium magnum TaxID=1230530 RepID=A0A420DUQ2_9FLAO|nr:hypothetical protein [Ichthyenterobacterium magnum]RKE98031.1 hypothetical protein BXY80_0096 [Ichthyenterobacterium magnum]
MNLKYISLLLFLLFNFQKQGSKNNLSAFDTLINKTWVAEGKWGNNSNFKQEVTFKYGLDKKIIIVTSKGFTNIEQTKYGLRNHGIRKFDSKTNKIKFWEFDVFGGLTEGTVSFKGKNIIYTYNYQGTEVTDMWEYVNNSLYNFKVGVYKDDSWKNVFLSTQFILKKG